MPAPLPPEEEIARLRDDIKKLMFEQALTVSAYIHELKKVADGEAVVSAMRQAAYNRGRARVLKAMGGKAAKLTPEMVIANYQKSAPDLGRLMALDAHYDSCGGCDLEVPLCPVKSAMEEAGATQEEFTDVVRVLDGVTAGTLEAVGLSVSTEMPTLHGRICCKHRIEQAS